MVGDWLPIKMKWILRVDDADAIHRYDPSLVCELIKQDRPLISNSLKFICHVGCVNVVVSNRKNLQVESLSFGFVSTCWIYGTRFSALAVTEARCT